MTAAWGAATVPAFGRGGGNAAVAAMDEGGNGGRRGRGLTARGGCAVGSRAAGVRCMVGSGANATGLGKGMGLGLVGANAAGGKGEGEPALTRLAVGLATSEPRRAKRVKVADAAVGTWLSRNCVSSDAKARLISSRTSTRAVRLPKAVERAASFWLVAVRAAVTARSCDDGPSEPAGATVDGRLRVLVWLTFDVVWFDMVRDVTDLRRGRVLLHTHYF